MALYSSWSEFSYVICNLSFVPFPYNGLRLGTKRGTGENKKQRSCCLPSFLLNNFSVEGFLGF